MTTSPRSIEQDICLLDELSARAMALACDLQERCVAVADAREAADLAMGFQRAARSVRQTIALKAKLERERERRAAEARARAAEEAVARVQRRKAQVRLAVERAVWDEAENERFAEILLAGLDDRLDAAAFADDFCDEAAQDQIARFCDELGVTPPAASTAGDGEGDSEGEAGDRDLARKPATASAGQSLAPDGGGAESLDAGPPVRRSSG